MAVSVIEPLRTFYGVDAAATRRSPVARRGGAGSIEQAAAGLPNSGIIASKSRVDSTHLDQIKQRINMRAEEVRTTDEHLHTIENHVQRMKTRLATFVKHFPPFPPGSEERIKMLRAFSTFRNQMRQLTIPPDADPDGIRPQQTERAARQQAVDVHRSIPPLGADASDHEITEAVDILDGALKTIETRRAKLADEFRAAAEVHPSGSGIPELSDQDTVAESERLATVLDSTRGSGSLTSAPHQLAALLG